MYSFNKLLQSDIAQLLDSDDEFPDSYVETAEIPAYLDDNRFTPIEIPWLNKLSKPNKSLVKNEDHKNEEQENIEKIRDIEPLSKPIKSEEKIEEKTRDIEPLNKPIKSEEKNKETRDIEPLSKPIKSEEKNKEKTKDIELLSKPIKSEEKTRDIELLSKPIQSNGKNEEQKIIDIELLSEPSIGLLSSSMSVEISKKKYKKQENKEKKQIELKENETVISTGIISCQDLFFVNSIKEHCSESTLIWFIGSLKYKSLQNRFHRGCLISDFRNNYKY